MSGGAGSHAPATRLGLVRCEHCGRQFNPHSGARHIPWCAKQQSESRKHKLSAEKKQALERYKWRINYKPSNQIPHPASAAAAAPVSQQQQQQLARGLRGLAELGARVRKKKSSINSSATLSSPSASSSAGGNSLASVSVAGELHQHQHQQRHTQYRQQQQQPPQGRRSVAQLGRSISSLTLTKLRGSPANSTSKGASVAAARSTAAAIDERGRRTGSGSTFVAGASCHTPLPTARSAKSVGDLYGGMSELVESLAKRVDEIYAQNQILLANLKSQRNRAAGRLGRSVEQLTSGDAGDDNNRSTPLSRRRASSNHNHCNNRSSDNTDQEDDEEEEETREDQRPSVRCHHCRASCLEEANYCHRCGCKMRAPVASSSTTSASPATSCASPG